MEFSYLRKGNQYYPLIDIELTGSKGSLVVKALVDSGASLSVFRPEIANYLAIPIKKGEGLYFQGIKGRIRGYLHRVPVRVSSEKFDCNIAFSPELKISFNLLGRNNFFLPFLITFNERSQKVIIEKNIEAQK
jgi:hypothetical protein